MIQTRLSQIAQEMRKHQLLSGVSIDVTDVARQQSDQMLLAVAASRDPGVVTFTHTYDPDLASAWLRECFRYTAPEIDRMIPQLQARTVANVWVAFGNYFKALNVRPYALRVFRKACALAWGGPPIGPTDESAARTLERGSRPYMTWDFPGNWRTEASRRFMQDRRDARTVIFGSGNENDETEIDSNFGCSSANVVTNANCPMPAEIHRLWMQNNGSVTGSIWMPSEVADGGVLDGDNTDMDGTDDGTDDDPSSAGFWNWRSGAWEDSTPAVGRNRLFVLAPLLWYWSLLCAPQPGLRVTDGGPDVSLVEWLYRIGPAEVLRTAKRDVVLKNALMLSARGRDRLAEVLGDAERTEGQFREQELRDVREIGNVLLGTAGAVLSIGGPVGIIGGVILGIAGAVLSFFPSLFAGGETVTIDLFGRRMTVVEVFSQQDATAATAYLESVPDPATPLSISDPHLPGPPPRQPSSPRPGNPTTVSLLPVIVVGPLLEPHVEEALSTSDQVVEAEPSGPSIGGVLFTTVLAIGVGIGVNKALSNKSAQAR